MLVIDCNSTPVRLDFACAQAESVTLSRSGYSTQNLPITNNTVRIPHAVAKGVWNLNIQAEGCCCAYLPVFINNCGIRVLGEHESSIPATATTCCE